MSVPKALRNHSTLEAQVVTDDFVKHTIHIMANEKFFDPVYHKFGDRIIDLALDVAENIWAANQIKVRKNPKRWEKRSDLQQEALSGFERLQTLIRIARSLYHLRSKKFGAWMYKLLTAEKVTKRWVQADNKRYNYLLS